AARERERRGIAHMPDAERVDEAVERDLTAIADRCEQIAHRGLAEAFFVLELDLLVARFQGENLRGLLHPALLEEELDLLLAEPVDVEGAARDEELQVLDLLERAGEFAGAAGTSAFLAGRRSFAHDVGVQVARAFLRELIGLGRLRALVDDDIHHLRDDVARALDDDRVADTDIAALADLLAVAANTFDVILVVQGRVLHDHPAHSHGLELRRRRERSRAPDSDRDAFHDCGGTLSREFVRDRPARIAADIAEPLLPIDAVHFVDDAVDVVVELRTPLLDADVEFDQLLCRAADL